MQSLTKAPRAALMQDLSGLGRCALSVAFSVLGAMGVQGCALPTAVLSTHTGGFGEVAIERMSDMLSRTLDHYQRLNARFEAVYIGYLASNDQAALAKRLIDTQRAQGAPVVVVDPVMADHGHLYKGIEADRPQKMRELCAHAGLITPNLTEALMLAGRPCAERRMDAREAEELLDALLKLGAEAAIITGLELSDGRCANACMERGEDSANWVYFKRVEAAYPGTGDLFTSVVTGALLNGRALRDALALATEFVRACVERTLAMGTPPREGVQYEGLLPLIMKRADE